MDSVTHLKPLVSVVMATYNGELYLKEQIDSIINQTYQNIEIIVVDDYSTDHTRIVLEEYALRYTNIHLDLSKTNKGHVKTFERGFELCKGDFIAPCDQDDIWLPNKIEELLKNIGNHPLIYCDSELIHSDGMSMNLKLSDIKRLKDLDSPLNYAIGGSVAGHAMLIRRETVVDCFPFPESIPHDYWLGFVATFSGSLKFYAHALVKYRQHANNTVGVNAGKVKAKRNILSKSDKNELKLKKMQLLASKCPEKLKDTKRSFNKLHESYMSFSFVNNCKRISVFLKHWEDITAYKKKNEIRRFLFCLKSFYQIY
ncbi:glycosyltransferase family 2 protein [Siphonobacter sp. SORGH_AS_1065]|uniref:glycosyltransferase family 2 protein n=1 Tax=Siphonobacter sp. SORGH_AS_1065 TaxID=3041795 RepID=UPI00278610F9|nr:glycosyltransferase family 2 protein [Siphonobacter sp. SORGH_AS_1065]MDQ1085812.1 glycosyltransferase involved in cell wall biosynthesis [Siphonobacter sp. SORGH_AS_1065]